MAAIRVARHALLRQSPGLHRRAADRGGGEPRVVLQLSSLWPRDLHSLLDRPSTAAGPLAPSLPSSMATSRCIMPSSRYMSPSSSSQSTTTLTRKELAVALMREPTFVVGDDYQEIKSCDEVLHLLKVDAKTDEKTTRQTIADARATIGKKKQELALLLLKEEVEGVGRKGYKEEVQEELVTAARRLRDSLLPQAQRRQIEDLELKNTALGIRFWKLVDCGIMVTLATVAISAYYAVQ